MAGTGGYAVPVDMPLVAKKPLRRKMSPEAKEYLEDMFSRKVEIFHDEQTGELYSKITDLQTGEVTIRKCEHTDED